MSFFQNAENRINKQFISIFDSVKFISEHGQGTLEQSFTYLDSALLKKQTHLLKVTAYTVKSVYLCSENDYQEIPPFMTIEQVKNELWACVERNSIEDGNPIFNLGFAKKRFRLIEGKGISLVNFDDSAPPAEHFHEMKRISKMLSAIRQGCHQ